VPGPSTVDEYLAGVPEPHRSLLESLRRTILAAAPGAVETISYQMPAIRVDGRLVVSYAAFARHCSLFPMSLRVMAEHEPALRPFLAGKGTARFTTEHPLPEDLVTAIVGARLEENAARRRR
jgi:uncharacterized protein YdhG (YjbR/CyaY superfamily)